MAAKSPDGKNLDEKVILDGKALAQDLRDRLALRVADLASAGRRLPGLAVVLVGDDPASQVYVASKHKQTLACGMLSFEHRLPADTSEAEVLALVARLNADKAVDGILVQLPLPAQIDASRVLNSIDPDKDVDGFHPVNAGRLAIGEPGLVPCTPRGCMALLELWKPDLTGLHAVVVGRSNIVGKPVAQLLLQKSCTVTIAHSKTRDLPGLCRQADILVAAVGRPLMLGAEHVKPGAAVIDVGINRVEKDGGGTRLVGDVDYAAVLPIAGAITPVPGGVGPMTIACLLENTLTAYGLRGAR
jgi:methylenetetrahydrofolate dehydrogenase (NADP+)/methenyltetrahydrofolate cyclohydrolase